MIKCRVATIVLVLVIVFICLSTRRQRIKFVDSNSITTTTTLVFIHIQKTAGSEFERAIVRRLYFDSQSSCTCPIGSKIVRQKQRLSKKLRCNCSRNNEPWLISRFSVGWLCGVHADWTTYHRCLPGKMNFDYGIKKRNFVYATLLREPIARFISEYLHTRRGATWLSERLPCQQARYLRNQSACWKHQNLTDFIRCPFNLAVNRQTRMLSSSPIQCPSSTFTYSNLIDLSSAKIHLKSMPFFGLTEYLDLSQRLFEHSISCLSSHRRCHFIHYLEQDSTNQTWNYLREHINQNDMNRIRQVNSDDIHLYHYAREIFFQRTCQILNIGCEEKQQKY